MTKCSRLSVRNLVLTVACFQLGGPVYAAKPGAIATDPISVVKHLYAAYRANDNATGNSLIAPGAVWSWYGPKYIIPFAGVYHGPEGVAQFFKDLHTVLKDGKFGQREYLVDGENVAVPGWDEGTIRATGGRFHVNNLHMFKVRNGKIIAFEEYIDNAEIIEAFAPADSVRGHDLLEKCNLIRTVSGEGRSAIPGLTGSDAEDLVAQLRALRSKTDIASSPMRDCATSLPGDRSVRDVAAYVASLPHAK